MTRSSITLQFQEIPVSASTTGAEAGPHALLREKSPLGAGTRTFTETREDPDQDPSFLAATTTFTKTIEEPDQDPHAFGLFVFPRSIPHARYRPSCSL